jgi:hypothetical protein
VLARRSPFSAVIEHAPRELDRVDRVMRSCAGIRPAEPPRMKTSNSSFETINDLDLELVHGGFLGELIFGAYMAGIGAQTVVDNAFSSQQRSDDRVFRGVVQSGALNGRPVHRRR